MVRRVHKYADGGKVVKDHLAEKPVVRGSSTKSTGIVDSIKEMIGMGAKSTKVGEVVDAKKRKSRIDQAIEDAGG